MPGCALADPRSHQAECRVRIKVALAAATLSGVRNISTAAVTERSSASIRRWAVTSSRVRVRATLAQDRFIALRRWGCRDDRSSIALQREGPSATHPPSQGRLGTFGACLESVRLLSRHAWSMTVCLNVGCPTRTTIAQRNALAIVPSSC